MHRLVCPLSVLTFCLACGGPEPAGSLDVVVEASTAANDDLDARLDAWFAERYAGATNLGYLRIPVVPSRDPRVRRPHAYYRDVAYGNFSRNRLDLWIPTNLRAPTPLAIFMHGGGFRTGDKNQIQRQRVTRLLAAGVAVASINYRLAYVDPALAVSQGVPNDVGSDPDVNGARLDHILRDCARAVQFLRFRAGNYSLDPTRFGAFGPSAGGGCAMWTATAPDLAQPDHVDPTLRASSRLQVVGHDYGQVTYNWLRWPELLEFPASWLYPNLAPDDGDIRLLQTSRRDQRVTPAGQELNALMDYYEFLSPDDPPMMTVNLAPSLEQSEITDSSEIVHHPRGHVALYERCLDQGLECEIETQAVDSQYDGDVVDFLIAHLR